MATSGNLKQPCFVHELKFKHLEMECVKLEINYDDGTKKARKCQRFSGKEGIKGLLFVEDRFCSAEVLVDTAEDKWMAQVSGFAERPTKVTPQDHSNWIKTMVRYANKIPGLSPNLTEDWHPKKWRKAYIRAGKSIRSQTLVDIIEYMFNEKAFADTEDSQKKRKNNKGKGGQGTRNRNMIGKVAINKRSMIYFRVYPIVQIVPSMEKIIPVAIFIRILSKRRAATLTTGITKTMVVAATAKAAVMGTKEEVLEVVDNDTSSSGINHKESTIIWDKVLSYSNP
eukprot:15350655-Ditylum_brightwellii.AAC.2